MSQYFSTGMVYYYIYISLSSKCGFCLIIIFMVPVDSPFRDIIVKLTITPSPVAGKEPLETQTNRLSWIENDSIAETKYSTQKFNVYIISCEYSISLHSYPNLFPYSTRLIIYFV